MANSKKRAQPTTAAGRPAKKRKSAEASTAKMKEIVDAEEEFSEEEKLIIKPAKQVKKKAAKAESADEDLAIKVEQDDGTDVEGLEEHDIQPNDVATAVAPGFRLWDTTSKLATKGEMSQVSKFDEAKGKYSHFLKVDQDEAFTLVPLTITQGPYKGINVFMLQPLSGFRLMALPPEIRNIIYSLLLVNPGHITITGSKMIREAKRPIIRRDNQTLAPMFVTLLRSNKQVYQEASTMLYGSNTFHFSDLGNIKLFADSIGDMRSKIRHIELGFAAYYHSKARSAFSSIKDATSLRTFSISYTNFDRIAAWYWGPQVNAGFVAAQIKNLMKALNKWHTINGAEINVLDIVKVVPSRCDLCRAAEPAFSDDCCKKKKTFNPFDSKSTCREREEKSQIVEREIREKLAQKLGLED